MRVPKVCSEKSVRKTEEYEHDDKPGDEPKDVQEGEPEDELENGHEVDHEDELENGHEDMHEDEHDREQERQEEHDGEPVPAQKDQRPLTGKIR